MADRPGRHSGLTMRKSCQGMTLIEVLVAFLQAFIFTMLTAVFIGQALEGEHHEEAHAVHH